MKLLYDLDFNVLRDANLQEIKGLVLRYKDQVPLEIQYRRANAIIEPADVSLVPVVKLKGEFDSDPLCPSVIFTKTGTGDTAKWTGNLIVDSPKIEEELKDNSEASDDIASFLASFQLYSEADGGESRSQIIETTITNSLYRGSETFPVVVDGEGLYVLRTDIDTDPTFAADSDVRVPSQKAVATAIAAEATRATGAEATLTTGLAGKLDRAIAPQSAAFTAVSGGQYKIDTTAAVITVTLPASPAVGDRIFVEDPQGTWATHNLTIARNGKLIGGAASDLVCDQANVSLWLEYVGGAMGWQVFRNS